MARQMASGCKQKTPHRPNGECDNTHPTTMDVQQRRTAFVRPTTCGGECKVVHGDEQLHWQPKTTGKMETDERKFCRCSGVKILHTCSSGIAIHISIQHIRSIRCSGNGDRTLLETDPYSLCPTSCTPKCEHRQCETPGQNASTNKKPHYGRPLFMALIFGC